MKNKDAIEILKMRKRFIHEMDINSHIALDMAIEALEKQIVIKEKIHEICAELDGLNETAYNDYRTTSDSYFAGVACAFDTAKLIVSDGLDGLE